MKCSQKINFQVKTDLIYLQEVLLKFESLRQNWINQKDWLQCQLALAEGFTNAVRHAHKGKPMETPIEIEIQISEGEIDIKIWDYGKPFPLKEIMEKQSSPSDLATGGRGINILRKIADELEYNHHEDDRNCLLIKKKLLL